MSCSSSSSSTYGPQTVWSNKSTSWFFQPLTDAIDTASLKSLRTSIELRQSTGAIKARVAYRLSDDGSTWDSPLPLYTDGTKEQVNDGITYGAAYATPDLSAKLFCQLGAQVANTSGAATEIALVTVRADRQGP